MTTFPWLHSTRKHVPTVVGRTHNNAPMHGEPNGDAPALLALVCVGLLVVYNYMRRSWGMCAVCRERYTLTDFAGSAVTTLCCGHRFHTSCIHRWLCVDSRCCLCRACVESTQRAGASLEC